MPTDVDPRVIWLEAERFSGYGGWVNDAQFLDLMGSPYLLATGMGTPVEDASTRVNIPQAGGHRLWVRCKDWHPEHSPGRFQVLIDGRAAPVVFGQAEDSDWHWVDGGRMELPVGEIEVRLHDLIGWWSRCDAIVLSADPMFRPSEDPAELARQRQHYGGISREVQAHGPFDVVVVGGGLAGTAAAIAGARHSCRVALIQNRPVLGGNASDEIQVPALGDETREPWDPRETGILEDLEAAARQRDWSWSAGMQQCVQAEPGIELYLDTHLTAVEMESPSRIAAVDALVTRTGQRLRFSGKLFLDCTGDAWLGYRAGADYRQGREARDEFNESLAPEVADRHTMGNTLYAGRLRLHDRPVAFKAPAWACRWTSPEDFEQRTEGVWSHGERPPNFLDFTKGKGRHPSDADCPVKCWFAELGGMQDTIGDAEWIRDELFRVCIGLWDYVKNHHPEYRKTNECRELAWLTHVAGKRESRRLMGDYVMSQHDYTAKTAHRDTVAYGGWTIDDHHPQGFFARGPTAFHAYLSKVSIPYRSLYSRNIENLMMAGRNLSATHVALGGVRVMRTCCLMGQAAGTAAAIAVSEHTTPRGVYEHYLDRLQQTLLKDGVYLPGVRNQDPDDLARQANITASTFATTVKPDWIVAPISMWGIRHPVDRDRAVMFRAPCSRIVSVALHLTSEAAEAIRAMLTLRAAAALGDFNSTRDLACAHAQIPARFTGWVDFPLKAETVKGDWYYLFLTKTPGLMWGLYSYHPPDTLRGFSGPRGDWGTLWGCYRFRLQPGGEPPPSHHAVEHGPLYDFSPANVINGFNRAVHGAPNAWAPDPEQPLPAWLELAFAGPAVFNTLHVSFQSAKLAPSRYTITATTDAGAKTLVAVEGNELRRRVHHFETIRANCARLNIEARREDSTIPLTPVCEIRLYHNRRND